MDKLFEAAKQYANATVNKDLNNIDDMMYNLYIKLTFPGDRDMFTKEYWRG